MFSWSTNFPDLYQLQGPDSDSVGFTTNFASDEQLSLEQPTRVPVRENTTSNVAQARPHHSIQHRGNVSLLELEQREERTASIPMDNDVGRRQETDTTFAATWDETSQNTARFNSIVQQLENHTRQLDETAELLNRHARQLERLTMAVGQLEKSVGRLDERLIPLLPEYPAQQELWQRNTSSLLKEVLDLRQYQRELETRLHDEHARLLQEQHHSCQLEQKLADSQWAREQVESALCRSTDVVAWLRQQLDGQKMAPDLDSRVDSLASLNESLLKSTFGTTVLDTTCQKLSQIGSDLQRQEELIRGLLLSDQRHEELIRSLQTAFDAALLTSPCSSACGCESATIVGSPSRAGDGYFPPLPLPSGTEAVTLSQGIGEGRDIE
ncbi:hypothetical protein CNMCM7691_002600 [Aspergillus felis]|uniref:Uncharacterized protein n=1 Tax=Aspergillus felis TaxID=1287682 RepID=A0A8H6R3L0_9EURO|nr:hypothetical protein CNMCM7691_002600 [Aspergillus felis]